MNKTPRNPKCDPLSGDLLWRPAGNGKWQCVQIYSVANACVRFAPISEPEAACTWSLPLWQREAACWRLKYPKPNLAEHVWLYRWPQPRTRFISTAPQRRSDLRYDERRE